jgi:WD40 repeat protein
VTRIGVVFALWLMAWMLLCPLATTGAWEPGKPITPAKFPRKPTSKNLKLPDGGFIIYYQDGSRVWVANRTATPLYFEPHEKLPESAGLPDRVEGSTTDSQATKPNQAESRDEKPMPPPRTDTSLVEKTERPTGLNLRLELRPETRRIRALSFTSDDQLLAVALDERKVAVFDLKTPAPLREIPSVYGPAILLVPASTPKTMYVVEGPFLRLTDLHANKDLQTLGVSSGASANGFVSADGGSLILASAAGGVEFLKANLSESIRTLVPSELPKKGSDIKSAAAAYDDNKKLAASGRPNGSIFVWSLQSADPKEIATTKGHSQAIDGLDFVDNKLVSLGRDGALKLWNPADLRLLSSVPVQTESRRGWLLGQGRLLVTTAPDSPLLVRAVSVRNDQLELSKIGEFSHESLGIAAPSQIMEIAQSTQGNLLAVAIQEGAANSHSMRVAIIELPQEKARNVAKPRSEEASAVVKDGFRVWSSKDGRFRVEARIVSVDKQQIMLERKDNGKVIGVSADQLSEADRAFIEKRRP